jgi:DNA-binding MarR family transcriptional regulator
MAIATKNGRQRPERFGEIADELRAGSRGKTRLATSELAGSLGFLLRLASGVALADLGARLEVLGMRTSLYSVLLIIGENPGLKQQDVGAALSIQQPNLVALVNQLVTDSLVDRQVVPDDRRSYALRLTPEGERRLALANEAHRAFEARLAEAIGPPSLPAIREGLMRILDLARNSS